MDPRYPTDRDQLSAYADALIVTSNALMRPPPSPVAPGKYPDREKALSDLATRFHFGSAPKGKSLAVVWRMGDVDKTYSSDCAGFVAIATAVLAGETEAAHVTGKPIIVHGQIDRTAYLGVTDSNKLNFDSRGQWIVEVNPGVWAGLYQDGVVFGSFAEHLERSRAALIAEIGGLELGRDVSIEMLECNVARLTLRAQPWQAMRPEAGVLVPIAGFPSLPPL